jgi:hypothetical protein
MFRRTFGVCLMAFSAMVVCGGVVGAEAEKAKKVTLDTDPNLAGWWKFDETSGKVAADSSRHGRKGLLLGDDISFEKGSADGRIARALRFTGRATHVRVTKYKGVTQTRPRTISAWLRTKEPEGEIVSWGADEPGQMWQFCFIRARLGVTPKGGYLYMNEPVHDDKWHHVAVVVRRAELPNLHDDVVLYKDGEPAEIHDIGLLDLWPIETGAELDVSIGSGFNGLLDDVRIYDRPLSEDEIKILFTLQSNRPLPKP